MASKKSVEVVEVEETVVHHLERQDSGTNTKVTEALPSLND